MVKGVPLRKSQHPESCQKGWGKGVLVM